MQASDVDSGDTQSFSTTATVPGFTLNADGSYSFDPSDPAYQHLPDGQGQALTIPVTVADGSGATSTADLTITLTGTNDGPRIAGDLSKATPDDDSAITGTLSVADADTGESAFQAVQDVQGRYGTFSLTADGHWTYSPDDRADAIAPGRTQQEDFTVHSVDGTARTVSVTVTGSSDQSLAGDTTGAVSEDGTVTLSGDLTIRDDGGGVSTPHFGDHVLAGTYGSLDLRDQGHWIYNLDNQSPAVQGLKDGQVEEERFHITLPDGTTEDVVIRVTGTGDAPVIQTSAVQPPATLTDVDQITDFTGATDLSAFSELNQGVPVGTRIVGLYMPGSDQNLLANIAQGDLPTTHAAYDMGNFQAAGAGYQYLDQNQWFGQNLEGGTARFHALAPSVRNNFDGGLIVFDDGTVGRLVKVCDDDRANGPGDYVYFNKVNGVDAHTGVSVLSGKGTAGETVEVYEGTQRIGTATVDAQGYWRLGVPKLADGDHAIHTVVGGVASEPQTVAVSGDQADIHDPPAILGAVAEDDAAAHSLSGQMTVTDADANDHPVFAAQQDTDGAYGTFSIDADGAWRYTLDNGRAATQALPDGQSVHETFIVEVATDSGETAAQSVQVTVTGANDAPALSVPAARTVAEDAAAISGQLTGSDADAGDTLSFSLATTVAGFALSADGSYTFDPSDPAYQNLPDGQQQVLTIPITVSDSSGATSTQNLVVTVTGANDAPTATAAPVTVAEDAAPVSGRIAGADPDSGETLTYSTTAAVPGFVLNADGGYSFDPSDAAYQGLAAGASHPITIPITVTDGAGAQATQDLVITVTGANDAPVVMATSAAPADLGATTEDAPARFSEADLLRLVGASDADGSDSLTIAGISSPHGAFTRGASGDWVFTPAADYHGDAVDVTVRVSDGVAETTAHATIDVTPVTDAAQPALTVRAEQQVMEFSSGSGSGVVNAGVIQAGGAMHGLTVDMTILGGQQVTSSAGHGATLISYATPSDDNAFYIWRPENMKFRIGGVEYETGVALLSDGQDHRYTFSWDGDQGTLDVLIDGRVAAHLDNIGRGATLADGGKFAIGNDQDSFGGGFSSNDAFTGQIFNTAIAKTAVPAADLERSALANLLDGDPDLLTNIQAEGGQFRDSTGNYQYSAVGTVGTSTVEVDTQIATPNPGATLKLALDPGAPSDGDDHVSAQTLAGFPAGTIVSDGSGHSITVTDSSEAVDVTGWTLASLQATPPVSFHGNMNIAYSVTTEGPDGTTETALDHAPVVLDPTQPIPDATIAGDDDATTPDDDAAVSGVLTIADADGSQAHFLAQTETAGLYGKFSIDAQGAWSYAPDDRADALADGASASESFTVSSADGTTHRVTIAVTGSNDAPTANAASVSTTEDAASFTGSIAGADPDSGETLTYTTTAPVPGFALDPDGGYSFDPSDAAYQGLAAGASHPITIPITVTDGAGAQVTHDLVITLTGANDAPVVTATSAAPASLGATDEDTPITFSEADLLRLVGASDADAGDTLHITAATSAQGSFAQQPDGSWVFTPARDFSGDDVAVTLTVSDGAADVTAQGVLDIAPTADRPSLQVGASAGGVVYGRADFSAASAAVHFDLTTQDYQSPGQGLRPGRYAVTSATGGGADDTFRVSTLQDGDSYTIDGGAGRNTLDLSAYRADQVAIDTATGVATVTLDGGGSATVHFSNIAELRFDSAVFDGTPHAIEPVHGAWTVEGTSLSVAGGASKQVALADYAGALQADYTLAATVHAHTNGGMNKTGGIVFDYQDEDNFKMAVLRAGQGGWNIEEYRNGQLVELERVSDATMATPDADHQVELRVHGSVAELWSGGELKASHDFGTPLNGGRFGVVSDGGQTDFQLAMQPSDWAPAAPDVDARMDVSDGALGIPNVLDQAVDHEGAALSLSAFDAASAHGGRVASNGDGSFRYEPPPGFSGADSFTYTITDGVNETTATVRVNVVDLHTVRHVTPGDSFELDISAAGNDQDGSEQVETRIVGLPDGAVVSDGTHTGAIDADHPLDVTGWRLDSIEIAPPAGQTENYAFSVQSRSVDGDSASPWSGAALRVELQPGQPFPDAAIAGDDSAATADDDTSVSGSLSVSDSDAADAHFVAQTDTDGQYGTFSIDDQGQWTYAPDDRADALADGTNATESFTVKSADGTTHTVDIEVTGSDEAGSQAAPPSAPPTSSSVTDYMQFAAPGSQNPSGSDEAGEDGQGDSAVTVYLEVAGIDPSDAAPGAGSSDASGPSDDPQLYNRGDASADDALTDTDGRVDDAALDGAETDPVEAAIQDDPQHHGF
ncbi:MAG: VCBS domain-containing protein [Alphaproteobacteria bacterium]|nr:VCBS domain-containing protein [Alphaproteobacteria bacterium]